MDAVVALALSMSMPGEQVTSYRSEPYVSEPCLTTIRLDAPYTSDPVTYHVTDICGPRWQRLSVQFRSLEYVNSQQLASAICAVRESRAARPCGSAPTNYSESTAAPVSQF